jgi:glycosyltransferase involved in cell wall biosynthesis
VKLAFVFPPGLLNKRCLDFANLLDDPRGTTGSEITALAFPFEMVKRGHEVTLFVEKPNQPCYSLRGGDEVSLRDFSSLGSAEGFDAVLAVCIMNDIDLFRNINPRCLRVVFQQVNDFMFGAPGFDEFVDLYISPSEPHRNMLVSTCPVNPAKWVVIPNGCYPGSYPKAGKTSGRCVWLSSPDRGLHHTLAAWPKIKAAVPHASLRIFYYGLKDYVDSWKDRDPARVGIPLQFAQAHRDRARIIDAGLKLPDVTVMGAVSRNDLAQELSQAEVMPYLVDCLTWTEGFSCSTLESCAAGALPVICATDAMGEIYRGAVPMVQSRDRTEEWTSLVIRALTVPEWADRWRDKALSLAERHAWPLLAERLEKELLPRLKT